ncbi:MAG: hypothetical protein CMM19_13400 [Rhodospirillaceae bacterium]|nr:hypothetical protein [Rhodospirillaceae bacterium]
MLRIGWYRLWIAMGCFVAIFTPLQLIGDTVLPQYADDVHLGVTSCAGSTCHGATSPWKGSTVLQNEYITWDRYDPHSKAYSVLLNDVSKQMAENLGIGKAHEAKICLDCHADNVSEKNRGRVFQISDGVGCEACHGGGERWLGLHVSGVATHQDNIKAGLYPTEDPIKRAELCLSCHFGNDKKIVTHRIMGAGHPRLDFELDTFTATQPAHYEIDKDYYKRKVVSNGIQTWAIGQALALEKRFDALLKMGETGGIFPELVLFDCQACHHSLMTQKWQPRPGTGLGPGVVRFDDSNLLMLQIIVESINEERGEALQRKTIQLHKASTANSKEFYAVAESLRDEAKELVSVFAKYKFGKKDVENLLFNLVQRTKETEFFDYVGAEQAIMGITSVLAAADKMGMKKSTKQIQASLDNAYQALENYDSWDYAKFKTAVGKINLN